MQGHSNLASRKHFLKKLGCKRQTNQPSYLSIGSKYDTMDPEHMKWIANEGTARLCAFSPFRSMMTPKPISQRDQSSQKDVGLGKFKKS
jgi:proline iminopeptidase